MTLQNRVTPDGRLVAEPWRGAFMGNRGGRIHDPENRELRQRRWASKRWIMLCHTIQEPPSQRDGPRLYRAVLS